MGFWGFGVIATFLSNEICLRKAIKDVENTDTSTYPVSSEKSQVQIEKESFQENSDPTCIVTRGLKSDR